MNNLKKYRTERRYSLRRLANLVGCSNVFLSRCELGQKKLSYETASKIAEVLNVDVYELLGDDIIKVNDKKDIDKAVTAITRMNSQSLAKAFRSFISSYIGILESDEPSEKAEKPLFLLLWDIGEYVELFTADELRQLKEMVDSYLIRINMKDRAFDHEMKEDFDHE